VRLRDRDVIVTKEGLIFRVFGYSHPTNAFICDAEYAPATIFRSDNPKAFRNSGKSVFYKFYEDEGWRFINGNFPKYTLYHEMLQRRVVGVQSADIARTTEPKEVLAKLLRTEPTDELLTALQSVLHFTSLHSDLSAKSFGVFGSMLHGFHHPKFSDIDLIIYGKKNTAKLRETLQELYDDASSPLKNEFETDETVKGKQWRFLNYSPIEFLWHQRRKAIYALFNAEKSRRIIKTEFEPVKDWSEIRNEYSPETRILQKGWVRMTARISEDSDAPFIPSIYGVEPLEVLGGARDALEVSRVVSYMEEFRMQAFKDEKVYLEGNLEEVVTPPSSIRQVALTYCPRYYEQALKVMQ
jgi:predicted nucleotidyltransferase